MQQNLDKNYLLNTLQEDLQDNENTPLPAHHWCKFTNCSYKRNTKGMV